MDDVQCTLFTQSFKMGQGDLSVVAPSCYFTASKKNMDVNVVGDVKQICKHLTSQKDSTYKWTYTALQSEVKSLIRKGFVNFNMIVSGEFTKRSEEETVNLFIVKLIEAAFDKHFIPENMTTINMKETYYYTLKKLKDINVPLIDVDYSEDTIYKEIRTIDGNTKEIPYNDTYFKVVVLGK